MKTRIELFILIAIACLLLMTAPAIAQDSFATNTPDVIAGTATLVASDPVVTPEPTPVVEQPNEPLPGEDEPISTPADLFEQLVKVLGGTYIGWAAAGVLVLTGLVKMIGQSVFKVNIEGKAAILVSMIFQVAIWVCYSIAVAAGKGDVFKEWYLAVIELARSFLPFAGAIFAAQLGYIGARKINAPVMGYKPPKKPTKTTPAARPDVTIGKETVLTPAVVTGDTINPAMGAWQPVDGEPQE